ncbi:MAG: AraC family transcriptional regulator [Gammaproteobacteria bacterium]
MPFVNAIVAAFERYGRDAASALAAADIDPATVDDPAARITAAQMERVSEAAMRELDDEALGWFTRRLPWGSYGMLCRASLTAPDLGVALKRWCRHHALLTDDVLLTFGRDGTRAHLAIAEVRRPRASREFCLVTLLRYVHGYACWAVDSRIPLADVHFPFARPAHADAYPLMFPGPVRFDAASAGFSFDARYAALPLVRDEPALTQMLRRALPLTVLQYRRDRLLVRRARELITARPDECRDAAAVAHRLNVSTRTLFRHLREAGTSLQALKNEARCARAVALLQRTQRPLAQVARAVGFDNEKSFARAFRQWTGQAPGAYRRAARGAA